MAMKGVSSKTHSQKQLDDHANQYNSNNKAYKARMANSQMSKKALRQEAKRRARIEEKCGALYSLEWYCYTNPYDFE